MKLQTHKRAIYKFNTPTESEFPRALPKRSRLLTFRSLKTRYFKQPTKKNYLQVNECLICMLPQAVLAFVTNEQPTAARRAKPGCRNPSSASLSARPTSTSGDGRPFRLSRISPLCRYDRSDYFPKVCLHLRRSVLALFLGRVLMRQREQALCHHAIGPRRLREAFGPVIEKGHGHVFLSPGEKGLLFLSFSERMPSAGTNGGQLEHCNALRLLRQTSLPRQTCWI